jgi:hypothetical protein
MPPKNGGYSSFEQKYLTTERCAEYETEATEKRYLV